ncbi:MAG: thermonuclease family protein [Alphaproteobacteria bacterium]|nr:thermonuclease family protein [Alphaproteobacteria bacterium]
MSAVVDGDTIGLADGREVRLLGIAAPKRPLDLAEDAPYAPGETAREALAALVLGREVKLSFDGARSDRHGRVLAQVHLVDGRRAAEGKPAAPPASAPVWVEAALVAAGHVRVMSRADNRACAGELLRLEDGARADRRSIWSLKEFAVHSVAETPRLFDRFEIVEGRVLSVAEVKDWTYLNFGAQWRTDFTVSLARQSRKSFKEAGIDLSALEGRRVRVRGWITRLNGPMIEITHPEELEILDDAPQKRGKRTDRGG